MKSLLRFCLITGMFFLLACSSRNTSNNASKVTDSHTVADTKLELMQESDSIAYLNITREGITSRERLKLAPPCYFLQKEGKVQDYSFLDVEAQHVLLVAGTMASEERKKKFSISKEELCGSEAQGVIFEWEKIKLSEKVFSGNVYCKDLGVDNLYFYNASHIR